MTMRYGCGHPLQELDNCEICSLREEADGLRSSLAAMTRERDEARKSSDEAVAEYDRRNADAFRFADRVKELEAENEKNKGLWEKAHETVLALGSELKKSQATAARLLEALYKILHTRKLDVSPELKAEGKDDYTITDARVDAYNAIRPDAEPIASWLSSRLAEEREKAVADADKFIRRIREQHSVVSRGSIQAAYWWFDEVGKALAELDASRPTPGDTPAQEEKP